MHDMIHSLADRKELRLSAWGPPGPLPANLDYTVAPQQQQWLADMLDRGGVAHLLRSKTPQGLAATAKLALLLRQAYRNNSDVDLYHINWLQGAILLPANSKPCLITVLGTDLKLLNLPGMKTRIRQILKKHKCILAPNAAWMEPILNESFRDHVHRIQTVAFGIDNRWYSLRRRVDYTKPRRWVSVIRVTRKKSATCLNGAGRSSRDRMSFTSTAPTRMMSGSPPGSIITARPHQSISSGRSIPKRMDTSR